MSVILTENLKEIALIFARKYYPQYVHRVNRIWNLFLDASDYRIPVNIMHSSPIFEGFGFAGEANPELKKMISGIAVIAFTYQEIKNKESVSEKDLESHISATCLNHKINPSIQIKLENVLREMLPSLVDNVTFEKNEKVKNKVYEVYLSDSGGMGTINETVSEKELRKKYLHNKNTYDIFVCFSTAIKNVGSPKNKNERKPIIALKGGNKFNLLVLLLKHKDFHIPSIQLYNKAWKKNVIVKANETLPYEERNNLKTAINGLRKIFNDIDSFNIPHGHGEGYICNGKFEFCLILNESDDHWFCL